MKYLILLLFSCLLFACETTISQKEENTIPETENREAQQPVNHALEALNTSSPKEENKKQTAYARINMDSLRFEGLDWIDSKISMLEILGEPDTTFFPYHECGPYGEEPPEKKFEEYRFGSAVFIVYNDTAELQQLDFMDGWEMRFYGKSLNANQSFDEVLQLFQIDTTGMEFYRSNIEVHHVNQPVDEWLYFIFENDRLVRMERYAPC